MADQAAQVIDIVRKAFPTKDFIPLHEPCFNGHEKQYLANCIDSTFVSYLGEYVTQVENKISQFTGSKYCLTMVNGTAALHMALLGVGVSEETEVLTQPLTFVATTNAIHYCGADPVFIDVDQETLGMCPDDLRSFLKTKTTLKNGSCYNNLTGKKISACVPVHIFGHPLHINEIVKICAEYNIPVVEDAAESLGSYRDGQHTGTFGDVATLSFNGNKVVTCGGGGAVITNSEKIYLKLKHISTTAKKPHAWEYFHDEVGYNYRMPNLNAAVLMAQFEQLDGFLQNKRELAEYYKTEFSRTEVKFLTEPKNTKANYWLNAIFVKNKDEREHFLKTLNAAKVMCRPAWTLMSDLPAFEKNFVFSKARSEELSQTLLNIPSSVRLTSHARLK